MKNCSPCAQCGCEVWLPDDLYAAAKHSEKISFFCPYGHSMHYLQGDSEATKLRRERDRLAQRIAQKDDEIKGLEKSVIAKKGQITKLQRRFKNGVCPCCTRSFTNLRNHMQTEHPEFKAQAAE